MHPDLPDNVQAKLCIKYEKYLEHVKLPFISYPYEWSYEMLKKAALFQLELMQKALLCDMILKDATPYNFQWVGPNLYFIDIPSFVKYNDGDMWIGYQQFCQLFLYPLMIQRYKGIPFQSFLLSNIDGIPSSVCNKMLTWKDRFKKGVFLHVYMQSRLQTSNRNRTSGEIKKKVKEFNFNRDFILRNVRNLHYTVTKLSLKESRSTWSGYSANNSYTEEDKELKKKFVKTSCTKKRRRIVLDIGCNTGEFSLIASRYNDYVISIDA